ncbi:NAD-dependent epimerase/dehydratase family protein [Halomicroarcula sp. F13]|uniref:NAD-dependent epimerase/dehydratase family protein n=1 Tax=Haloarcula rubra TaxID=2487747 RepID=A0AAW4PNE2_9EURY|nr:NAD-dependent epimerase/dehydratase family protein [Halomicroarcula rubra]MBX0322110.1 NAD-dependent epimerase/dehydratase family protein [Halomicroarcula rubra]
MTVLVTGATGFIGLNLLHAMTDREAVAMVRPSASTARLPDGVETVESDLSDPDSLAAAMEGVDAVVHLAAAVYAQAEMERTNTGGTERLVDAAAEADVETFVFLSTVGAHPEVPTDTDSPYQRSKVAVEDLLFGQDHPFDVAALYPTYIFGPRDYRLTRYEHVRPIAANRVLVPPLYTYDEYNVVHVDDVVGSVVHCLDERATGRHLITGPNLTNRQVLGTIARHAPGNCRVVGVPYGVTRWVVKPTLDLLHRVGVSPVPGDGFLERGDFGTVREDLTERAPVRQRSWQSALTETIDWYESVGVL